MLPPDNRPRPIESEVPAVSICLRLYLVGRAPNSQQAVANLQAIVNGQLAGRCQVEIIDVLDNPQRALTDGILVTPTLVRLSPLPVQKIVGNLADHAKVRYALGLEE